MVHLRLAPSTRRWLWPRARSPWAPPAATGEACLNLTSLTDLCNQHGGRTHPASDRSSLGAAFPKLRSPSLERPPKGDPCSGTRAAFCRNLLPKHRAPVRRRNAGSAGRICLTQHARCGAVADSGSSEHLIGRRFHVPEDWRPRSSSTGQGPRPTSRANGTGHLKNLRCFPPPESHGGELLPPSRHPSAARRLLPNERAFFHDSGPAALTGWPAPDPRREIGRAHV